MRGSAKIIFNTAGGIAVVVASFYTTLKVMDYFDAAPAQVSYPSSIKIEEATYGANCPSGVKLGNATQYSAKACDGHARCNILISVQEIGDPAPGCGKDFSVRLKCNEQAPARRVYIKGEANGSTVRVDCDKAE